MISYCVTGMISACPQTIRSATAISIRGAPLVGPLRPQKFVDRINYSAPNRRYSQLNFTQRDAKVAKVAFRPLIDGRFQSFAILLLISHFDPLHMFRLPVEAYETADQEIASVFGGLVERLV